MRLPCCKRQESKVYPYLLENLVITKPNQVWGTDISYIPTRYGWTYLMAIMDLHSRMILGWKLSATLEVGPCVQLLKETVAKYGAPDILNQDQGSQYTSREWTETVEGYGIRMSMAGKGRCYDNIRVERGWRSLKQEEVYLKDYVTLKDARENIGQYFDQYNHVRLHQALGYRTPASVTTIHAHGMPRNQDTKSFCFVYNTLRISGTLGIVNSV
jgi:putative transposase